MVKNYSNRELDSKFTILGDKLDETKVDMLIHMQGFEKSTTESLNRIESQTIKTNGRVSSLENYKWALIGAWIVITAIILPLIAAYIQAGKL